jgi:D-allulose-6-phosphate 3-epimerase
MSFLLSDSLMCLDFLHAGEQLAVLDKAMDWHHADVMDGHFCPNITLSPDMVKAYRSVLKRPIEVHLMVDRPTDWIDRFGEIGVDMISLHSEVINNAAFRSIHHIKNLGCKVGIVLNPATPLEMIRYYVDEIDRITLMSVDVGYAGQQMVPQVLDKIRQARDLKAVKGLSYEIQVDGCCNRSTYRLYHEAGADMLVMGSGLFGLDNNIEKALQIMRFQQAEALADAV